MKVVKTLGKGMVPRAGVEPARPFGQRILSPQRLPFRHPGMLSVNLTISKNFLFSLSHQNRDAYVDEPKMSHHFLRVSLERDPIGSKLLMTSQARFQVRMNQALTDPCFRSVNRIKTPLRRSPLYPKP